MLGVKQQLYSVTHTEEFDTEHSVFLWSGNCNKEHFCRGMIVYQVEAFPVTKAELHHTMLAIVLTIKTTDSVYSCREG